MKLTTKEIMNIFLSRLEDCKTELKHIQISKDCFFAIFSSLTSLCESIGIKKEQLIDIINNE